MSRLLNSVAFRLAVGYGALVLCAVAVISAVLYFATVGVLGREIDAKLLAISERLTSLPVRAEVENPDGALKCEMFANFSIITGNAVTEPAVPEESVVYEGQTARVWIAGKDKSLGLRQIRTGRTEGGMVEVLDGLQSDQSVVSSGSLFIDRAAASD